MRFTQRSNRTDIAKPFSQLCHNIERMKGVVLTFAAWGFLLFSTPNSYAGIYHVEIKTSDLNKLPASVNAPFSLDFQFNDGGVLGNNSATITNFSFSGGAASGSATTLGGATGDIGASVIFDNSSAFQELYQTFTPGTKISFDVTLTQNVDGITPDSFVVSLLDKDLFNIPTGGLGDSLLQIDVNQSEPLTLNVGRGLDIYAGVVTYAAAVPEPGSLMMFGLGIAGVAGYGWRRRNRAV